MSYGPCPRCGVEYDDNSSVEHECADREMKRRLERLERIVEALCDRLEIDIYELD